MRISPSLKALSAMLFACSLLNSAETASASERLGDGGFEASTANGMFPNSGSWLPSSSGPGAGAICTTTATHSGMNGLWVYTCDNANEASSVAFQMFRQLQEMVCTVS